MKSAVELFSNVFELIRAAHEGIHGGHDIFHAMRVATWAQRIALKEWGDKDVAELAGLAGLCHNADRLAGRKYGRGNVPESAVYDTLSLWLDATGLLSEKESGVVLKAVMNHDKRNGFDDSRVQIALMDADKVVNLDLDLVIRSGQFYHDLPAVDYAYFLANPDATYRSPGSSLKDISYSLEWVDPASPFCIRTVAGMEFAKERADALSWFIETLKHQLEEGGLVFVFKS